MEKNLARLLMLVFLLTIGISNSVSAYTIDGDLTDWGLKSLVTDDWSVNETWVPDKGIRFLVEDNHNPNHSGISGVHIKGVGDSYTFYDEPLMTKCNTGNPISEPYGNEPYDLEAMYFVQDTDYFYVAIVSSLLPDGGGDLRPGDLALNLDNDMTTGNLGYEYGVKIHQDPEQGYIIKDPVWDAKGYLCPVGPDIIKSGTGTYAGIAEISYNRLWLTKQDNGYDNYVIEMCINKSDVNVTGSVSFSSLRVTDNCINEHISYVPEFPGIAVSLALIIGSIFAVHVIHSRKKDKM